MRADDGDVTYGLDSTIWNGLEKTFDKNSKETFQVLNEFVHKVILMSIRNNSLEHFRKYVIFYPTYYSVTFLRNLDGQQYAKLHKIATEAGASGIRRILSGYLRYDKQAFEAADLEKLSVTNGYVYLAYNAFSRLFYYTLKNKDLNMFRYALIEFNQIDSLGFNNFKDLRLRIRVLGERNPNLDNDKKIYAIVSMFEVYRRHVLLGLKFWAYYMYQLQVYDESFLLEIIGKLRLNADSNELLEDIIAIRNKGWDGYFEWMSWDFMERPPGEAYNPPNSRDWLTFGFLVDIIRERRLIFNVENYSLKELQDITFLYESLLDHQRVFERDFEKWKNILKVEDRETLGNLLRRLWETLEQFKNRNISGKEKQIAEAELSADKIQEFYKETGESWKRASLFRNLFKQHNNRGVADKESVKDRGFTTPIIGGKKMFIADGEHSMSTYNSSEAGRRIATLSDDAFASILDGADSAIVKGENLLDVVLKGIKAVSDAGHQTNLIVLPAELGYEDESLISHKDFIWRDQAEIKNVGLDNFMLGYFQQIPVYQSDSMSAKVLVCDFRAAFSMKYFVNEGWYESELSVKIIEIGKELAEKMYREDREYWQRRSQLSVFSDDDIIYNIMNAVILETYTYDAFEITDKKAYIIGIIYNEQ